MSKKPEKKKPEKMTKKELLSELFDMDAKLFEAQQFGRIGDEKLEKAYKKVDKQLEIINKIKDLLNNK